MNVKRSVMKKKLIYILGIIVALLILFSGLSTEMNAIKSGSREALMFITNEIKSTVQTRYRFAKQSDIQHQTATENNTGYLAIEYVSEEEHDNDFITD